MSAQDAALKRTPLHAAHVRLGGRLVEFAGFEMPVQYSSILDEHAAVRHRCGLFDVSHMGQIHLLGPAAVADAERLVSCKVSSLRVGRVRYGVVCNENGGVVDDVTVYRMAEDEVMLCVNAANVEKDHAWILANVSDARVENRSDETALLALQGPTSTDVLSHFAGPALVDIKRFRFAPLVVDGVETLVSNTGYTGSPGYEIYLPAEAAEGLFERLLSTGSELGIVPAGLGARDTLRLEAALPLYGHELDDDTSPLAAGLDRFVKREVGGFIGAEAIEERAAAGHTQVLVGFELEDRGVARAGHAILRGDEPIGRVTSGGPSPTLGRSIGLGYVPPEASGEGSALVVQVRKRNLAARVVATPFVTYERRPSATNQSTKEG
jgi:aminomethyltransferase